MSKTETGPSESGYRLDRSGVSDRSVRRASVIAGSGLLVMAVFGIFANFVVLGGLITPGDATQTANDVINAEGVFRLGIASLFAVAVLDVVVAWALYTVFVPVDRRLALLAAWIRIVYAGVFVVAISQLVGALSVLTDASYLATFDSGQRHVQALLQINTFYDVWGLGLALFSFHLLLLGYLAYEAAYAPRYLGALLVIAGLGYLIDGLGPILSSGYTIELALFTFVGELVLIAWLLLRGRRVELNDDPASMAD